MVDFEHYTASGGIPAAFLAAPITVDGKVKAVVAGQLSIDALNNAMTSGGNWVQEGLGKSGESYLVGPDMTARTDSRFLIEDKAGYLATLASAGVSADRIKAIELSGHSIINQRLETRAVKAALDGATGTLTIPDYRGVEVMSAFAPVQVGTERWAILVEKDTSEALDPMYRLRRNILLATGTAAVLLTLFALWSARAFLRPITRLQEGVQRLKSGDDDFTIDSFNDVKGDDNIRLDSGGVLAIATGKSHQRAGGSNKVIVGQNALLKSNRDINLSTHADVRQEGRLTVKVYGLAGSPGGYSSSIYAGQERVEVGTGATITALGDINLLAGRTSAFSMNRFNLKAYTDLFNGTVFGFSRKGAEARAEVDNQVIVGAGSNILGNADVNLVAEKGFSPILVGNALSQSLLEKAFGSKDIDRNEKDNSSSAVTVNGLVKTGINKDQVLVINEQLNTPATISASDTLPYGITFDTKLTTPALIDPAVNPGVKVPAPVFVNVGAGFAAQIDKLRALKAEYSQDAGAVTGFNARIDALYRQAADLGLVNNFANPPTIRNDYFVPYIVVPEIVAGVGSVYVFGETFKGSGTINSPMDAKIQITNNSPYGLNLLGLTIPFRTGGKLLFNTGGTDFSPVSSASDITSRNKDKGAPVTLSITAPGNATGPSAPTASEPSIYVENTWRSPGSGKANNQLNLAEIPDPDINITGDVNNTGGKLTLISPGSVIINGNLSAKSVSITAGRDFVLNSDGFFSSGGDPKGQWAAEYKAIQSKFFNNPSKNNTNINLQADPIPTWVRQSVNTPKQGGTILALNNIYINAQYLNIDGTIQSGRPDNNLTIPASKALEILAFKNNYRPGNNKYLRLSSAETNGIDCFYNAETNRIEVTDTVVKGGYIQLMGRTFSTGNGSVKVMDGFGNIAIDNQTSYDLQVKKLDTGGLGIEGKIVIIDTSTGRSLPLDVAIASASKDSDKLFFNSNPYLSTGEEIIRCKPRTGESILA